MPQITMSFQTYHAFCLQNIHTSPAKGDFFLVPPVRHALLHFVRILEFDFLKPVWDFLWSPCAMWNSHPPIREAVLKLIYYHNWFTGLPLKALLLVMWIRSGWIDPRDVCWGKLAECPGQGPSCSRFSMSHAFWVSWLKGLQTFRRWIFCCNNKDA